jgi:hypothetical protein
MKTAMQELIETLLSIKSRTPQNLHFEKGLHSAIDSCINEAELLLEKEKEQMCEFAVEYVDDCCYADVNGSVGCEDSAEEYFEKTFNTKER